MVGPKNANQSEPTNNYSKSFSLRTVNYWFTLICIRLELLLTTKVRYSATFRVFTIFKDNINKKAYRVLFFKDIYYFYWLTCNIYN